MKAIITFCLLVMYVKVQSQTPEAKIPNANVRLSFLLLPFTPLLTLEVRTFGNVTLQLETNFVNTHGANIKYFIKESMNEDYVFLGTAFVEDKSLRKDLAPTVLPYAGYGYSYRFVNSNSWIFDSRIGIGATINADKNGIYPIIKTGIGKTF